MSSLHGATAQAPPLRVLLVEDDEFDVAVFNRAFHQSNTPCEVVRCRRGEEVIEGLRDADLCVDLLVADHQLPGIPGFDLCVQFLEENRPFALVLLTGGGSEQMAIRALRAGIHEYIVKDSSREYLELLPLVLPRVARRQRDRWARTQRTRRSAVKLDLQSVERAGIDQLQLEDCAALALERGGEVWLDTHEAQQPMLHFTVPLAASEVEGWTAYGDAMSLAADGGRCAPVETAGETAEDESGSRSLRRVPYVLVVHPNPIVSFVVRQVLARLGYRYVNMPRGEKALEALEREPFDLVLIAPRMPGQDGTTTARQIRQSSNDAVRSIPIVALAVDEDDLAACREAGIDELVPRKISFASLRPVLERVVANCAFS
ncbi:MAG: response regulator [Acidobacteriota bacterium]